MIERTSETVDAGQCPACGEAAAVAADAVLGEIVWCNRCGVELEVVSTDPLRVDVFEEEEK